MHTHVVVLVIMWRVTITLAPFVAILLFEILLLWQAWVNAFSRPKAFCICNMFFATVLVSIAHNTYFYILISSSTDDLLDMETNN